MGTTPQNIAQFLLDPANVGAALAATSALSTAAFGLLEALKIFGGGPSNFGICGIKSALQPYAVALTSATGGAHWWPMVRDNWIAGVDRTTQKAKVTAMIRLGLTEQSAPILAGFTGVDVTTLTDAAKALATGGTLTDAQASALGRMNAVIELQLDAAFERASHVFGSWSRVSAGAIAVVLSIIVWWIDSTNNKASLPLIGYISFGLVAIPLAPIAKDITSAVSAAAQAFKAARRA